MEIARLWLMLLVFAALFAVVQAPPHKDICGLINFSITLLTSFDAFSVKEVKWKFKSSQKETIIATIKDGKVTYRWINKYKPLDNGIKLVIENLTEVYTGIYTAEATYMDGELRTETFNITIYGDRSDEDKNEGITPTIKATPKGQKRHHIVIIPSVIVVSMLFALLLWKCWKRSSDTIGQDDHNNEANVNVPIQETGSQESSFIKILHEKSESVY